MQRLAIHSVPRSGSTWLGSIFDSHPKVIYKFQPLFSYQFKDRLSSTSSKEDIDIFFEELVKAEDDFLDQVSNKQKGTIPEFEKDGEPELIAYKEVRYHHILQNLLDLDSEVKVVGLVRNPLSTIHSWLNAPKEFRTGLGWEVEDEWRYAPKKNQNRPEEFNGYEKWKEVAYLFEKLQKRYHDRFYLVCYKDLLMKTTEVISNLFPFVGLSVSDQTKRFINTSRTKSIDGAYSVYRIKKNDDKWKEDLSEEIVNFITDDLKDTCLEKYVSY